MRALIEFLEKWADVRPASPNVHGMVTPNHLGVLPQRIGVPLAPPKPMTNSFSVADANFKPTPMPALPQTNASRPMAPVSNQPPPAPQLSGTNAYRSAATQPIRTPSRKTAEYRRHTGVADVNGEEYVNSEDVLLLGKLGFDLSDEEYGALEKTSEVLDIYSYLEKVAGIPKVVGKAVDKGLAFSGEFLKDMDYEVPKGYEIKGDLCCPMEKEAKGRCWEGYKPVKGKKPYSEDSCEPVEAKKKIEKAAVADPAQTILITGHSGSGKTTLSRDLAERLKLPVRRVDAHRGWDNYIRGDDKRWKETLTAGTKENSYFGDLVRRATKDTLKNAPVAGIIEGTQLGHLPEEELAKFKAHIVVGGSRDQSILQRIKRSVDKASKQGVSFSPAEMETKKIKAEYVADYWEPGVEKFRKIPGVIHYNHTEDKMEPLVEKIKAILDKK